MSSCEAICALTAQSCVRPVPPSSGVSADGPSASLWTQQMKGTDRQFVSIDDYTITEEDANDEFATVYTGGGLIDLRTAIAL